MKLQTNWESNMKSLQVSYEERLKEMRGMREQINAALDELEKATLKEMDEGKASWNTSLKFDIDSCSRLHTELTHFSDAIKEIGKKNEELAFIAHQKSKVMLKHVEKYLNNNSLQTEVSFKLIVYNDIIAYLSNLSGLSHTTHITKDLTKKRPDRAILVTGANLFSVKIEFVFRSINGICGLFNGHILFAHGETLKLLDLQHKVISKCFISYYLSDMCLITPCKVAVTEDKGMSLSWLTVESW
ncbi:hypothetical protein DPMN_093938 [Dreissena polymorpha]|uniref:Uncharacterized protein n=1 Tax=Dreissena polymorpha TaxID=45954 RepID=A0A9D4L6P8_DREPO|nr:hypothetical protein DPMN_093938 [Dreissena polymorpha]